MENIDAVRLTVPSPLEIPVFGKRAMTKSVKKTTASNEKAGLEGPALSEGFDPF